MYVLTFHELKQAIKLARDSLSGINKVHYQDLRIIIIISCTPILGYIMLIRMDLI